MYYVRLNSQQNAWIFTTDNFSPVGALNYRLPGESLEDWDKFCQSEGLVQISFEDIIGELPPTADYPNRYLGKWEDWRERDLAIRFPAECRLWQRPVA